MLPKILEALSVQTYPDDRVEVIVVDNGSEDGTLQAAKPFNAKLLAERKQSPYAARNRGLNASSGEILTLLDSGTIPAPQWIEEGIRCITENHADLAGGNIVFNVGPAATAGEIFDAITFADNRKLIEEEGGAAGGNLFFKREVWNETGQFPEHRTGMDIWWTQKATRKGFKLLFAEQAVVHYEPRGWVRGLKKSYRVGTMHPYNMRGSGKSLSYIIWHTVRCFSPQDPQKVREKLTGIDRELSFTAFLKVWLLACANKISMGLGRLRGLLILNKVKI